MNVFFLHKEDNKSFFFFHHCFFFFFFLIHIFIAITPRNKNTNEVTFRKYAFLHHILVLIPNYMATVYAKAYYFCWFKIAVTSKVIYVHV